MCPGFGQAYGCTPANEGLDHMRAESGPHVVPACKLSAAAVVKSEVVVPGPGGPRQLLTA